MNGKENKEEGKMEKKSKADGAKLVRETEGAFWFRLTDGTLITVPKRED